MNCPACGSEMWDNRPKKASGVFKPTAPDFKCKNPDCKHVEWPEKKDGAPAKKAPAPSPRAGAWDEVHAIYGRALAEAKKVSGAPEEHPLIATGLAIIAVLKGLSGVDAPVPVAATPVPAAGPAFDGAPIPEAPPPDDDGLPF